MGQKIDFMQTPKISYAKWISSNIIWFGVFISIWDILPAWVMIIAVFYLVVNMLMMIGVSAEKVKVILDTVLQNFQMIKVVNANEPGKVVSGIEALIVFLTQSYDKFLEWYNLQAKLHKQDEKPEPPRDEDPPLGGFE